ncbi:LacI family DNA-binding transcriptional regulator [Streptococcus infantis]|uniref:LacI family DNA-binding transcriptional regulator n=1 Tax=Streptococcus infantis TaxID=68892 RepID=UPI001CBE80A9|nr:LacI family DNA-binding transcriptional regulator [Streptococcus infantis]MBZ2120111.1 LacI family DNA-binding transcriptional regulator [Streptococcus infantis]MBZ2122140.1 LacI family DNA-binding transcriptional regulator [Streptococcus infantis]MBZ2125835.1 LacI family DNA-binding transcriptional regulator [Streptococcus infantis]
MPVTIKDVAKAAGVSPSTVTRVIQNKSTISDETKKRVRKAMKELNYHPNLNARSLVSSYTQVIGLVLPDDSDVFYQNPFFPSVLRGIAQVASENHYAIQIATGKDEKERLNAISQMVYGKRVDGLIFLYAQENDPLVQLVVEEQFPFLILGKSLSPFIPLVDNDNIQAGFDATEYFIKKGCSRIAFIGGTKKLFVTLDRLTGYEQALQEHNLPLDSNLTYFATEFLEDNGYRFSRLLFKHNPNIDAIITIDSLLAAGVCDYIAKHQLDVPVLSFDSVNPKLNLAAYVDINSLELGRVSFETILQIIDDAKNNKQICYRQLIAHEIVEK